MEPRISIIQQWPAVELKRVPPVFELRRQAPRLEITGGRVAVRIDQTRCFAERGLKPPAALAREAARSGQEAALAGIGRRAEEGDHLAAIEKGGTVADLAVTEEEGEVILLLLPRSRPAVDFPYQPLVIRVDPGAVEVVFSPGRYAVKASLPPYVRVYLTQGAFLQAGMVSGSVDLRA
ncbi:DUF6470 family protein [Thermodesulfitimonas sp.]